MKRNWNSLKLVIDRMKLGLEESGLKNYKTLERSFSFNCQLRV
jgi:hypothetical protein